MKATLYLLFVVVVTGIKNSHGALWEVIVYIDTRQYSESRDTLLLDVRGTTNSIDEISLGNNFRSGETRRIPVDEDFGRINNIRLYQKRNDGIRVRKVCVANDCRLR